MIVQSVLALIDFLIAPHGFALSANQGTHPAATAFAGILVQTFAEGIYLPRLYHSGLLLALKRMARRDR